MLGLLALVAAQAAAPVPPAQAEAQARKVLAARGMSTAGIDASIAIEKRHEPALRAIVQRGTGAETAIRTALAKRPVDVDGFARAMATRSDAAAALGREAAQVTVDQMRALSPADRVVLAQGATRPPAAPAKR